MSRELPDTLPSVIHKTKHCGFELYVTVTFQNGPKEVFVTTAREGSILRGMLHVISMLISVSLRAGITWGRLREKLLRHKFDPYDEKHDSLLHTVADAIDTCIRYYNEEGRNDWKRALQEDQN